jgi:hypothetical protein
VTFDSRQQPVLPQTLHTMTTSDETAETWRDLADQLTAAQITQLEAVRTRRTAGMARQWAVKNTPAAARFDNVAPPAGAVRVFGWQRDGNWFCDFEGIMRRAGRPTFISSADSKPTARNVSGSPRIPDV